MELKDNAETIAELKSISKQQLLQISAMKVRSPTKSFVVLKNMQEELADSQTKHANVALHEQSLERRVADLSKTAENLRSQLTEQNSTRKAREEQLTKLKDAALESDAQTQRLEERIDYLAGALTKTREQSESELARHM